METVTWQETEFEGRVAKADQCLVLLVGRTISETMERFIRDREGDRFARWHKMLAPSTKELVLVHIDPIETQHATAFEMQTPGWEWEKVTIWGLKARFAPKSSQSHMKRFLGSSWSENFANVPPNILHDGTFFAKDMLECGKDVQTRFGPEDPLPPILRGEQFRQAFHLIAFDWSTLKFTDWQDMLLPAAQALLVAARGAAAADQQEFSSSDAAVAGGTGGLLLVRHPDLDPPPKDVFEKTFQAGSFHSIDEEHIKQAADMYGPNRQDRLLGANRFHDWAPQLLGSACSQNQKLQVACFTQDLDFPLVKPAGQGMRADFGVDKGDYARTEDQWSQYSEGSFGPKIPYAALRLVMDTNSA